MSWSKQETFPDGSWLDASVTIDGRVAIQFKLNLSQPTASTRNSFPSHSHLRRTTIPLYTLHEYAPASPLRNLSDKVWEELFALYRNIFKVVPGSNLTAFHETLFRDYSSNYFRNGMPSGFHALTPKAQAIYLITPRSRMVATDEMSVYQEHADKNIEVTDLRTALYSLRPGISEENENVFLARCAVHSPYGGKDYTEEYDEYLAAAFLAMSTKDEDLKKLTLAELGQHLDLDREAESPWQITNFPLSTSKFRNYLMGLTAEDYVKLLGKVPKASSAASAITIAERILKEAETPDERQLLAKAHNDFQGVFEHLQELGAAADTFTMAYQSMMSHAEKPHLKDLSAAFFLRLTEKDFERRPRAARSLSVRLNTIFDEGVSAWITPKSRANDILEHLCEVLPPAAVVKTIEEVVDEKEALTAAQWGKFISQADLYSEMPVSWWKPLVKAVRSNK